MSITPEALPSSRNFKLPTESRANASGYSATKPANSHRPKWNDFFNVGYWFFAVIRTHVWHYALVSLCNAAEL